MGEGTWALKHLHSWGVLIGRKLYGVGQKVHSGFSIMEKPKLIFGQPTTSLSCSLGGRKKLSWKGFQPSLKESGDGKFRFLWSIPASGTLRFLACSQSLYPEGMKLTSTFELCRRKTGLMSIQPPVLGSCPLSTQNVLSFELTFQPSPLLPESIPTPDLNFLKGNERAYRPDQWKPLQLLTSEPFDIIVLREYCLGLHRK